MEANKKVSELFMQSLGFKWNRLSNDGPEKRYLVLSLARPKNKRSDARKIKDTIFSFGFTIGQFAKQDKSDSKNQGLKFFSAANAISLWRIVNSAKGKLNEEQNLVSQYSGQVKTNLLPSTRNFNFSSVEQAQNMLRQEHIVLPKDALTSIKIFKNVFENLKNSLNRRLAQCFRCLESGTELHLQFMK
jgi:hypothetical protein